MTFEEVWAKSMCQPMEQLVDVEQEYPGEVEYTYMPACVPLKRCSGCCGDEYLECKPTLESNVTLQVWIILWPGWICEKLLRKKKHPIFTFLPLIFLRWSKFSRLWCPWTTWRSHLSSIKDVNAGKSLILSIKAWIHFKEAHFPFFFFIPD